jgi:glycosyltransferase involved in cell wall biosynthesis
MSRVLVVTSGALFVRGGHLVIAEETVAALRRVGHEAELLITPQNRFGRQLSAYLATWLTDVGLTADGRPVDQVISFRFPSYAVRHPRHVCWLNHRMREYYDLWPDLIRGLGRKGRLKESIRRRVFHVLDRRLLTRNVTRLVAQSRTIQERLLRFGRIESELIYPPAPERPYRCDGYGHYVFAVSRLDRLKRLDLLIEAAARASAAGLTFRIAGDGPQEGELRERILTLGLTGKVELLGRIPEDDLIAQLAGCRAVYFAPRCEDYGFVTLQAFRSGKAVITATDSGGPTELVHDGQNGFVVEPSAPAVARAIDRFGAEANLAEELGRQAACDAGRYTWDDAIGRLLDGSLAASGRPSERRDASPSSKT